MCTIILQKGQKRGKTKHNEWLIKNQHNYFKKVNDWNLMSGSGLGYKKKKTQCRDILTTKSGAKRTN